MFMVSKHESMRFLELQHQNLMGGVPNLHKPAMNTHHYFLVLLLKLKCYHSALTLFILLFPFPRRNWTDCSLKKPHKRVKK